MAKCLGLAKATDWQSVYANEKEIEKRDIQNRKQNIFLANNSTLRPDRSEIIKNLFSK